MNQKVMTGIVSECISITVFGQVGINTVRPHASAALEIAGTDKGFCRQELI